MASPNPQVYLHGAGPLRTEEPAAHRRTRYPLTPDPQASASQLGDTVHPSPWPLTSNPCLSAMEAHSAPTPDRPLSLEEFERLPEEELYRLEFVHGHVVREPAPAPLHGRVSVEISAPLHVFVKEHGLGVVLVEVGFVLTEDPPTVRVPDISFVTRDRIPPEGYDAGFWHLAPDLVIEILSPSNTYSETQEKVFDYLEAGSRLVWVVDPERRAITAYRSRDDVRILTVEDELQGGEVVPGFTLAIEELFPGSDTP